MIESLLEGGRRGAPTLVLLHGGGIGAWSWRRHIALLERDFHCLAPELPGHGSDVSRPFTFERGVEQVAGLIADRATAGVAHVAGLSLGGQLGLALAACRASLVDRLVVTGANVCGIPMANAALWFTRPFLWLKNSSSMARLSARRMHVPPEEVEAFTTDSRSLTFRSLAAIVLESGGFREPPGLASFDRPVLILAGQKEVGLIRRSATRLTALIPHATSRVVPGRDHAWPLEDPALFCDAVRAWFLDRPLPPSLSIG